MNKLARMCDGAVEAGWLFAVALVPLYFNKSVDLQFEPSKAVLLWLLALLIAAAWVTRWALSLTLTAEALAGAARLRPSALLALTPIERASLALAVVLSASTALALVPYESLFGHETRGMGLLSVLSFMVVFSSLCARLRTEAQLERLLGALLLPLAPICAYALAQRAGLDSLQVVSRETELRRVTSMLGQPVFLGAYLGMCLPFALVAAQRALVRGGAGARARAVTYGALAGLALVTLGLTESRGPLLGLAAGLLVGGLGYVATQVEPRALRVRLVVGALGLAGLSGAVALASPRVSWTSPTMQRLSAAFTSKSGSAQFRASSWEAAARAFTREGPLRAYDGRPDALDGIRPWLGYGPEAQHAVSPTAVDAALVRLTGFFVADRFHSERWEVLLTSGVLGLLAHTALTVLVLVALLRQLGVARSAREGTWAAAALIAGMGMGGVGLAAAQGRGYVFLGAILGLVAAVAGALVLASLRRPPEGDPGPSRSGGTSSSMIALAGLVAWVAHAVETAFSFSVLATGLVAWVVAALASRPVERASASAAAPVPVPAQARSKAPPRASRAAATASTMAGGFALPLLATAMAVLVFDLLRTGSSFEQVLFGSLTTLPDGRAGPVGLVVLVATALAGAFTWLGPRERRGKLGWMVAWTVVASLVLAGALLGVWHARGVREQIDARTVLSLLALAGVVAGWVAGAAALAREREVPQLPAQTWPRRLALVSLGVLGALAVEAWTLAPVRAGAAGEVSGRMSGRSRFGDAATARAEGVAARPHHDTQHAAMSKLQKSWAVAEPSRAAALLRDSEASLLRALELNPYRVEHAANLPLLYAAWSARASGSARRALAAKARAGYERALAVNPFDPELWGLFALFQLRTLGEVEEAEASARRGLGIWERAAKPNLALGELYAKRALWREAAERYRVALEREPSRGATHAAHVEALWKAGEVTQAGEALALARAKLPAAERAALGKVEAMIKPPLPR